jgi:molecular chaperone DnaK (HSP70)
VTLIDLLKLRAPDVKLPDKPIRALGIDLGTTNSTVAEVCWDPANPEGSQVRCIEVEQKTLEGTYIHVLVPSFVALPNGELVVGEGAKRLRARATEFGLVRNRNLFYECKNDIGTRKTYHRAQDGFRSAAEIGGKVLEFLRTAAQRDDARTPARTVVTVPASFQAPQRDDTRKAAELAGIQIGGGDLLDEPIAAFIDYLVSYGERVMSGLSEPKTLLVFDFGGGTCDIALFRLSLGGAGAAISVAPISVSRYHRLGGGDIDAAILYDVLLPQLLTQNRLGKFDLSYEQKKRFVEPALLGVAEGLKVNLCRETVRLKGLGIYERERGSLAQTMPGIYECRVRDNVLRLQSPRLAAIEFEDMLKPFLDTDLVYARATEYRLTCSIFAPVQSALEQAGFEPAQVDYCLMVGGSSLIPQVVEAMRGFLSRAEVLTFPDEETIQTAVARGAACHALALALTGRALVQPVCHEAISIRTQDRLVELVPAGATLPVPGDGGYARSEALAVPQTVEPGDELPLRVEVVAGTEGRRLESHVWSIDGPVSHGDPLVLEYRLDENQVLELKLRHADARWVTPLEMKLENPLTNVVNPNRTAMKIEEMEEDIRAGGMDDQVLGDKLIELADLNRELRHYERALDLLHRAARIRGEDLHVLVRMGICAAEMRDHDRAEKFYRQAIAAGGGAVVWFDLSLMQERQGKMDVALESIGEAVDIERSAPYLVQQASLVGKQGDVAAKKLALEEAFHLFGDHRQLNDWELGWYRYACEQDGRTREKTAADAEVKRRKLDSALAGDFGKLPLAR